MIDPASLASAIDNASKVANTPFFTTIIDKLMGFKVSRWAAEGEVRKRLIHDEYQKAKESGIVGMQYIKYLRNTTNLIDTATKSAKYIDQEKSNEIEMDNDFFWNTIEHAKTISNHEMQELVAKIIAGEYNQPGKYSVSTLQTLKMMGKRELELFETVCSLCIMNGKIPKNVFSLPENLMLLVNSMEIDFRTFQTLQNLGLFLPNPMTTSIKNPDRKNFSLTYFDKIIRFKPIHDTNFDISLTENFALSETGQQILQHLNPEFKEDYYSWLKKNLKIANYALADD